jgi:hypothetical protein
MVPWQPWQQASISTPTVLSFPASRASDTDYYPSNTSSIHESCAIHTSCTRSNSASQPLLLLFQQNRKAETAACASAKRARFPNGRVRAHVGASISMHYEIVMFAEEQLMEGRDLGEKVMLYGMFW